MSIFVLYAVYMQFACLCLCTYTTLQSQHSAIYRLSSNYSATLIKAPSSQNNFFTSIERQVNSGNIFC